MERKRRVMLEWWRGVTADTSLLLFFSNSRFLVLNKSWPNFHLTDWLLVSVNSFSNLSDSRPPLCMVPIRRWMRICFMCCVEQPCLCHPLATCCTHLLGQHIMKMHSSGCCSCRWYFSLQHTLNMFQLFCVSHTQTVYSFPDYHLLSATPHNHWALFSWLRLKRRYFVWLHLNSNHKIAAFLCV